MDENMNVGRITQLTGMGDYAGVLAASLHARAEALVRDRDEARDALAAAQARIAELEAALKPFAAWADFVIGQQEHERGYDVPVYRVNNTTIKLSDLQAAAAALRREREE